MREQYLPSLTKEMALAVDDSMWDHLGTTAAQSKRPGAQEAPSQQPMRAGIKPAQQKAPSSDQKRHRRQMSKRASDTATCPSCGKTDAETEFETVEPPQGQDGDVRCANCGTHFDPSSNQITREGSTDPFSQNAHKESTMTAQPHIQSEADLVTRLAAATTLAEQADLSAQIEAVRASKRESIARESSMDWDTIGSTPLPPSRYESFAETQGLPPVSAGSLRTTEATDWMDDLAPTHTEDAVLTATMRAQATRWYEGLWSAVKDSPQELSIQASNAGRRSGSQFGIQAAAAQSVFVAQVNHLASRDGINLTALETTVPTYVSDGKTTQPVGVESGTADTFDEWGIGSDANNSTDPKTEPGKAPSLSEGDSPEHGKNESVDNPNYGVGPDKSTWNVGDTSDRMNTQSAKTAISLTNVGIEGDYGVGTDPSGTRVKFLLTDKDKADLKAVLHSELSVNFSGVDVPQSDIVTIASRTAAEYQGGSPKQGDTAKCHKDGGAIQFFAGEWMHLKGTGSSHNDVHPATPREQAEKTSSLADRMAAEFSSSMGQGIETYSAQHTAVDYDRSHGVDDSKPLVTPEQYQRGFGDGKGSAQQSNEAPSLAEGDAPEHGHQESATQESGQGAADKSSATPADRDVNWHGASLHAIGTRIAAEATNANEAIFGQALARMTSLDDVVAGVSGRQIVSLLLTPGGTWSHSKQALRTLVASEAGSRLPFAREATGPEEDLPEGTVVKVTDHATGQTWKGVVRDGLVHDASGFIDPQDINVRFTVEPTDGPAPQTYLSSLSATAAGSWEDLKPGDKIRVGFEENAHDGIFVRIEKSEDDSIYKGQRFIVYKTSEDGPERKAGLTSYQGKEEAPRSAKGSKTAAQHGPSYDPKAIEKYTQCSVHSHSFYYNEGYEDAREGKGRKPGGYGSPGKAIAYGTGYEHGEIDKRAPEGVTGSKTAYGDEKSIPASDLKKGDILLIESSPSGLLEVVSNPRRKTVGGEVKIEVDVLDKSRSGESRPRQFSPDRTVKVKRYASRPQGGLLGTIAANIDSVVKVASHVGCDHKSGYCEEVRQRAQHDDFSLSDAKNEDGEWIMSPEQIRSEMNYERDPGDMQDDWYAEGSLKTANEGPTWSKPCERCGATVERWRGEGDVSCPNCNAQYNAGGQRLRDDWAGNPSNWDSEIGDMEGYEMQHAHDASLKTAMPSPAEAGIEIGDIYYASWGYDQTNIDFYEVTRLMGASIAVRPIGKRIVDGGDGGPHDAVVAVPGDFTGPEMTKRVPSNGSQWISLNSYSGMSKWDGKPKYQTGYGWGH